MVKYGTERFVEAWTVLMVEGIHRVFRTEVALCFCGLHGIMMTWGPYVRTVYRFKTLYAGLYQRDYPTPTLQPN